MQGADGLGRGRLDRIGDGDDGGQAAVDGGVERGLALIAQTRRRLGEEGDVAAQIGHVAVGAHGDARALDQARHSLAGDGGEVLRGGDGQAARLGGCDQGAGDRVFRQALQRRRPGQHRRLVKALCHGQICQFGAALGQGAGLVEGDDLDALQGL
ncbi:hypothetical protein D3C73_1282330 [compost metagenome]